MKSRFALVVLFAVFFVPGVLSQACSGNAADTMFKLSSNTNAHAAEYDQGPYTIGVCASSFTSLFPGSAPNPHPSGCGVSVTQPVMFWLSGSTNAHVSTNGNSQNPPYTTPVCYADLTCYFDESPGAACDDAAYTVVARASNDSNAHVELVSQSNYDHKICCKRQVAPSAYWADASGNLVSEVRVGQTVYATLSESAGNLTIDVYEDDALPNPNDPIFSIGYLSANSPNWSFPWTPTIAQAQLSEQYDYDDFKFDVASQSSGDLKITFCGDNEIQVPAGEVCDTGGNQVTPPSASYGSFSTFCNATTCQNEVVSGGYCGDNLVQLGNETCDLGEGVNGNLSAQSGPPGSFCSIDCRNETRANTDLKWEDLDGREITYAGRGDTVRLAYRGSTTGDDFNVYDSSRTSWLVDLPGSSNGSDFIGDWPIPAGLDLSNWKKVVFKNDDYGASSWSNILTIKDDGDDPITINISGVSCGQIMNVGTTRQIRVSVLDPDDRVTGYIKINGVEVDTFTNVESRTYINNYQFNTAGTTNIEVYAENTRGEKASAESNVLVNDPAGTVGATFTAACISKPASFGYIRGDYIEFDASTSRGLTQGPGSGTPIAAVDLTYNWQFSDGRSNPYTDPSVDIRAYQFNKSFSSSLGYNWAELTVTA